MGGVPINPLFDQPRDGLGFGMGAHDPGDRIVIGDRNARQAKHSSTAHILLGVRGPGEEGEIGLGAEFSKHRRTVYSRFVLMPSLFWMGLQATQFTMKTRPIIVWVVATKDNLSHEFDP